MYAGLGDLPRCGSRLLLILLEPEGRARRGLPHTAEISLITGFFQAGNERALARAVGSGEGDDVDPSRLAAEKVVRIRHSRSAALQVFGADLGQAPAGLRLWGVRLEAGREDRLDALLEVLHTLVGEDEA